jgi:hypothetical protein
MESDRRRLERVHLHEPAPGRIGTMEIFVIDVSLQGLLIAHQRPLGAIGSAHHVAFHWRGERVEMECEVVGTELQRVGKASFSKTLYHSAMKLTVATPQLLRDIVQWHVERALDEQKANARGVPPLAAQSFQTGKGGQYVRHELANGIWKAATTTDPAQPKGGFTISIEETKQEVAMLRAAYEQGDFEARQMIRKMAAMSISTAEGIPTRRYTP